ncbi:Nex18 symbiotically induced [Chlorella sorokiniana]|uniref:Nex18 symbiotically induced n=1 Tax=Chlorella sorokiniana TaxID=3076 RepID=A0A2P6TPT6_CHLSO|nr:Nex18 symbiotically induced [Chlorella sorokiniana]|eukprot:PRW56041.1 Nex18 symbiotically induced [Chlorella sorokiniana]
MNFKAFALLAILAMAGSAAAARKRVTKKDVAEAFPTVVDALVAGNYSSLIAAVELAGLTDVFGPDFEGTVFAPNDSGFDSLIEDLTAQGLAAQLADPTIVGTVLKYHVLNTTVKAADLVDGEELETLAGVPLTVVIKDDKVFVEDVNGRRARVNKPDTAAGKAIVHGINGVLLPIELPAAGNTTDAETAMPGMPETETGAPEGTMTPPTAAASGLMASAAAVAASLVAAAFLA